MKEDILRDFLGKLKGQIFYVEFTKKDGTLRKMLCRTGVTKYLKGGELGYDPVSKGLLSVYDLNKKAYRMVNVRTITRIKGRGITMEVK